MTRRKLVALAALLALSTFDHADAADKKYGPGASDTEIKLGQTVPYSGPASAFELRPRDDRLFPDDQRSGGINGRKITLISLDNAFSPPKAIEQTRKLVEDDGVLADVGTVGTTPNVAIQKYLNHPKVPHIFISAGGRRFADPQQFPWTVPMYPGFEMEGKTFGKYILKNKPNAKVAVLYQNDDYGKDFLAGLKAALGDSGKKVTAEASYEITDPTIDSQIVRLKSSGADVLLYFTTPKFTAQGLRKVNELGWTPQQFLASPTNSVKTVMEPAGFENAQGIMTTQFTKQAGDPAWANDPEVKEFVDFMKKWVPNDNPNDFVGLTGYINAQAIADVIRRSGDELTRENVIKQATSLNGQRFKMKLPGITLSNSAEDYAPYHNLRMAKFEGNSWKLIDEPAPTTSTK